MNDLPELESELKKMRPRAVSPELTSRIEHGLAEKASTATAGVLPKGRNSRVNWLGLGLGLAAAAAFILLARVNVEHSAGEKPGIVAVTPFPFTTLPPTKDS